MEWMLLIVLVVGVPLALAVWLVVRAVVAARALRGLTGRINSLEEQVIRLRKDLEQRAFSPAPASKTTEPQPQPAPILPLAAHEKTPEPESLAPTPNREPEPIIPAQPGTVPPLIYATSAAAAVAPGIESKSRLQSQSPPQIIGKTRLREPSSGINWEQFMGVKLFAWIGGLALFLGVAFFVKYSFDNNLIAPELRVAIGFLTGLGLLVGGVVMSRKDYAVLSQTFCATGTVILYAVTFACRSIYKFQLFDTIPTFLLMVLITTTAFLLAVRLNAMVVAILGMLGGFLTPVLLSSGQDNPFALFGYIAILDAGLILVALNRRWLFLTALAALGTAILQIGWAGRFFKPEGYFEGSKIFIPLGVLLGFQLLYLAASIYQVRKLFRFGDEAQPNAAGAGASPTPGGASGFGAASGSAERPGAPSFWLPGSMLGLTLVALGFAAWFLSFGALAGRPWLVFGFVFLLDLAVTALIWHEEKLSPAQPLMGMAVFALLSVWTANTLNADLLNSALALYFIFALIHSLLPVLPARNQTRKAPPVFAQIFPPLALVLVLIPIFKLADLSFLVWPFVFLVDLLAIGLAVLSASVVAVAAVLLLTLAATGALILKIPANLTGLPISLILLGAFSVFFVIASVWLARRFRPAIFREGAPFGGNLAVPANLAAELPSISAILPFLLLIMATLRLPLTDPSPVFGLALLLVVLLLGLTRVFSLDWLPAVALGCMGALEFTWHFHGFDPANSIPSLTWYLLFLTIFTVFPFIFRREFADRVVPWAAAALAGPVHFLLVYRLVAAAHPNSYMGLLPAAFSLLPLASLVFLLKIAPPAAPKRITQLALYGGVALFFITLIFPIQFERQWITIGWALEGAALLWLFHRLPHPGLRLTGAGLLLIAFARLAFNPAVLAYHARSATPIFNWYLYAYGITTVCLYLGARLLAPPRNMLFRVNTPPVLASLGTVLAFLLMNIQIADYFSAPGSTLTFQFSGNFARDMTYSIAWALFALGLLVFGIVKQAREARLAAIGLLSVTLLKLFFHDLARLGQLYRIGALVGVAVVAMLASLAYQKFFAAPVKNRKTESEVHETNP